ncbi:hypothetical protein OQA88_11802 [Cercophora sp. LCS_1]
MTDFNSHPLITLPPTPLPLDEFLDQVQNIRTEIRSFSHEIQELLTLHQRSLTSSDDGTTKYRLSSLATATQRRSTSIRNHLFDLKVDVEKASRFDSADHGSFNVKKTQLDSLTADFKREVQRLLAEEQRYRNLCREQIARQYRIVNPDATNDEVQQAAEQDEGVFQAALRNGGRMTQASSVLGAVRARHGDLQRVEKAIGELTELFQSLEVLVISDEAAFIQIEQSAENGAQDLERANEEIKVSNKLALHRRKMKWLCLGVGVLIVLILAGLGTGLYYVLKDKL